MFNGLPSFSSGSGPRQGPVGCIGASLAVIFMLLLFAGLFWLMPHAIGEIG